MSSRNTVRWMDTGDGVAHGVRKMAEGVLKMGELYMCSGYDEVGQWCGGGWQHYAQGRQLTQQRAGQM